MVLKTKRWRTNLQHSHYTVTIMDQTLLKLSVNQTEAMQENEQRYV